MTTVKISVQVDRFEPLQLGEVQGEGREQIRPRLAEELERLAEEIRSSGLSPDAARPLAGRGLRLS